MHTGTRQRRDFILDRIGRTGKVMVKDLSGNLEISEATVRRDLRSLADEGLVELVYGGATLPRQTDFSFQAKASRNIEAKKIIGGLAADLVTDEDRILLDSGSTAYRMVPYLREKRGLSVIVNSTRLAMELAESSEITVYLFGGQYRPLRMDTIGPLAQATLERFRGYRTFIGADGLDMEFGPAANDVDSAHLYGQAVRNGRETILLADHTKFRTSSLYRIVDWESISRVVTDREPDAAWLRFFDSQGISPVFPKDPPTT